MLQVLDQYADSTKVETLLIGSIIIDPENCHVVSDYIAGSQFHDPDLGQCFDLLISLDQSGFPVSDVKLLTIEFKKSGVYQALGGAAFFARACESISANCIHYAKQVRLRWIREQVEHMGDSISLEAKKANDPESIVDYASGRIDLMRQLMGEDADESLEAAITQTVAEIDEARKTNKTLGIPSGLPTLDDWTGGFHPGSLTVLAARPSVGKSAFAMDIAVRIAERNRWVFVVSLEMSGQDISYRLLSRKTEIDVRSMQNGLITAEQQAMIYQAKDELRRLPMKLYTSTAATVAKVKARAKIHKSRGECSLVVIDYLGLLSGPKGVSSYERITSISRELKQMAMELKLPVLCLAQLNREATKADRPGLSHLRDSGAIEQDADNVWILHRKDLESVDTELIIAKQRQGVVGTIGLTFDPKTIRFMDPSEGQVWNG